MVIYQLIGRGRLLGGLEKERTSRVRSQAKESNSGEGKPESKADQVLQEQQAKNAGQKWGGK